MITPRTRTGLWRDVRGAAIYVELLIVVPVFVVLWMFANYAHRLGESQVQTQRQTRQCVWAYATAGCQGAPPAGCDMQGPSRLSGGELDRVAGQGLDSVVRPIPTLTGFFRKPAGEEVVGTKDAQVSRPPFLGGSADTAGMDRMLCNDRTRTPPVREVVEKGCRGLLGAGGRCP